MTREAMMNPDPLRPVLSQIESTLRSGRKVFVVGALPDPGEVEPQLLPPAPQTIYGWKFFPYEDNWLRRIAYFIDQHGLYGEERSPIETQPVDSREHFGVFVLSGWRDTPPSR